MSLEKLIRTLDVKQCSDVRSENADSEKESLTRASGELLLRNIHQVISKIPPLEQPDEKTEFEMWNASDGKSETKKVKGTEGKHGKVKKSSNDVPSSAIISKKMKLKFSKAWMSFLTLPLPIDVYKEVLATLHQTVIPYLSNTILLCDFFDKIV